MPFDDEDLGVLAKARQEGDELRLFVALKARFDALVMLGLVVGALRRAAPQTPPPPCRAAC